MADQKWNVQTGAVADPTSMGVPPVPTTVYEGYEAGARAAYAEHSSEATKLNYRYVLLRSAGDVVEAWGTPPAAG